MILSWYQHLPEYISPIAFSIGHFSVRWYSVSYIVGFAVAYLVLMFQIKRSENLRVISHLPAYRTGGSSACLPDRQVIKKNIHKKTNKDDRLLMTDYNLLFLDLLLLSFFGALVGGRLGYVLFYDLSYFIAHPFSMISPYVNGNLVGIYGMSFHGALLGILLGSFIFLKIRKIDFLSWADFIAPAASLGYFFGRIGNFLNGELYGRATDSPIGMYFLADSDKLRHPSQLYEAFLEGILLFIILRKMQNMNLIRGAVFYAYLVGYGILRIILEQFRQPDVQIGYVLTFFTMGQILSLAMVLFGSASYFILRKNIKNKIRK
ncbi:MAG: Prolipoprotein diacylglyceryl transferase [Candidatus Moranbacteria bacterium GW2011_GWC2_37_8]|nr:MAG: Prolipoprotein diacylglyceryl transferase [Candidatus Moranbacteria bacterium GW2011_GWC2_37_8]KKQ60405.1 MAG: prolipoprotein diacylglyceryl transferase, phosphatidylglycerol:prolipoprotein diacylglycerol transferase [Parcubacteria group bacterium GW2011_GWC1_38_22]KKQ80369.1 MAG: Prolipoprotein diacylglyceryl transferase [Candidatus Moranbacteria bacterium GW2011_GWD2_38_7]